MSQLWPKANERERPINVKAALRVAAIEYWNGRTYVECDYRGHFSASRMPSPAWKKQA